MNFSICLPREVLGEREEIGKRQGSGWPRARLHRLGDALAQLNLPMSNASVPDVSQSLPDMPSGPGQDWRVHPGTCAVTEATGPDGVGVGQEGGVERRGVRQRGGVM
jgi:hypothetical protein